MVSAKKMRVTDTAYTCHPLVGDGATRCLPYTSVRPPPSWQPMRFGHCHNPRPNSIDCVHHNGLFLLFTLLDFPVRRLYGVLGFI